MVAEKVSEFQADRTLPYGVDQVFSLIADVEQYPAFVPLCRSLEILKREPLFPDQPDQPDQQVLLTRMTIGLGLLRENMITRVLLERKTGQIRTVLIKGPLSDLRGDWKVSPHDLGCHVAFSIRYSFQNRLFSGLAARWIDQSSRRMLGAFERRADELYGPG